MKPQQLRKPDKNDGMPYITNSPGYPWIMVTYTIHALVQHRSGEYKPTIQQQKIKVKNRKLERKVNSQFKDTGILSSLVVKLFAMLKSTVF